MNTKNLMYPSIKAEELIEGIISGGIPFPDEGTTGLLLYGEKGTGKTTFAKQVLLDIEIRKYGYISDKPRFEKCESPNNGVELMASIGRQLSVVSLNGTQKHGIIFDEVDNLTPAAMAQLKSKMNAENAMFVLTTNYRDKVDEKVRDRCHEIEFNPPIAFWLPVAKRILANSGITDPKWLDDVFLLRAIGTCGNSGRAVDRMLKELVHRIKAKSVAGP